MGNGDFRLCARRSPRRWSHSWQASGGVGPCAAGRGSRERQRAHFAAGHSPLPRPPATARGPRVRTTWTRKSAAYFERIRVEPTRRRCSARDARLRRSLGGQRRPLVSAELEDERQPGPSPALPTGFAGPRRAGRRSACRWGVNREDTGRRRARHRLGSGRSLANDRGRSLGKHRVEIALRHAMRGRRSPSVASPFESVNALDTAAPRWYATRGAPLPRRHGDPTARR